MKKFSLIIVLILFVTNLSAQTTKIWLTADSERQLNTLVDQFDIEEVKQALPDSRQAKLQNVYEVTVNGDYTSFLEFVNKSGSFSKPEVIEEFTLLYEPNDYNTSFNNDYALDLINAKNAWDITKGKPMIKLGILDSNFDTNHEELTGTYSFISNDVNGTNYNHGTAVAATAAGNTDNGVGKSSIGNECDMMLYGMSYNHILQATYAGARVVNLSWASGCYYSSYYQDVIDEVYNNGTVIIAAAGNGPTCGGADNYVYPASFNNVISVSSIGPNDNHERFVGNSSSTHQHNDSVDMVAPGYDVALAIANNVYTTGNGTSFAAPYVAGTVGLMLSVNPCLSPSEVEMILKSTAISVDSLNPNYAGELGAGRLDAHAAVQMAEDLIPIDFEVIVKDESCVFGNTGVTVQLNEGDINDYNLQWSDGSNQWDRNDLNPGTHNFTISSPNGCSINQEVTFQPTGPHFDYPNSVFINDENFNLTDSNNDGVINVRGSIVIESGVDYDLSGLNINFTENADLPANYPNSGIIIKDGAQVLIENTELNSVQDCSNKWGGIELWSTPNSIAKVTINNSTIENATIGVSNISKNAFNSGSDEVGGQIEMSNSSVSNSKIGVNIIETLGQSISQKLINNTFINPDKIVNPIYVNLNGARFISIEKNTFKGNTALESTNRGTAVKGLNSSVNEINTKPLLQSLEFNNTYEDLYKGLDYVNMSKGELSLKVYDELFTNVELCVSIGGEYNGEIAFNEFNVAKGNYEQEAFGIKTIGKNNIIIEENVFFSETSENNFGIISESNRVGEGRIKLNSFEGQFVNGINFIGENKFEEISCNVFDITGQYDWFIYKNNNGELGSLDIVEELNINTFSDSNNVELNLKNHHDNQFFHYKDAYEFIPYQVCESTTVEEVQIEIDRDQYCYNSVEESSLFKESLSTEENEVSQEIDVISIYPNPSNGVVNISNTGDSKIEQLNIMTAEGKIIETITWNQQQSIDLSNYSKGTYLIGLELGSSVKTERVVIL